MSWSAYIPLLSHVNLEGLRPSVSRFTSARLATGRRLGAGAGEAAGAAHRGVTTRNKQNTRRNVIILMPEMGKERV